MTFNILISCMHQKDASIIERTGVQSDVVVINQCDHNSIEEFDFINRKGEKCHAKFICTTERGLSRSSNMAIRYAEGDICEMLEVTDWGWSDHWFLKLQKWLSSKCKSIDDVEDCKNIFNVLCNSGKSDRIYNCFAQNLNNQPTTAELFPELIVRTDEQGNNIPLSNAEELYDLIMSSQD